MSKVSFVKEGAVPEATNVEVVGHSEGVIDSMGYSGPYAIRDGQCYVDGKSIGVVGVAGGCCPTEIPSTAVATQAARPPTFNDEDVSFDDIIIPRINIVQRVGDLATVFDAGEIVLNQSLVIHTPANKEKNREGTGALLVIPLGFKKSAFVEKVPGGGKGAYCETREDVVARNGTLDYREWKASNGAKKRFEELATCLFLIQRPEFLADVDHQTFNHEVDGVFYALALWSMKGTAFTNAAKRFKTERKIGFLKSPPKGSLLVDRGYPSFAWSLTTRLADYTGDNGEKTYAIVPVLTPGPKSSDAILTYVKEGIGLR